jgi:molybdenum-dependent DNA-binding transcriptional regulator ModE
VVVASLQKTLRKRCIDDRAHEIQNYSAIKSSMLSQSTKAFKTILSQTMKPNQLRMFIAVVEAKSIHRAALALGVSQPAVSATIRELEMTYGAPLLMRSSRGVEVTELGTLLFQRGRALLADMDRLEKEMTRLQSGKGGHAFDWHLVDGRFGVSFWRLEGISRENAQCSRRNI